MTVRIGSYTALERPDGGHRASGSAMWRGEDDAGGPVCLLILPVADAVEVRARVVAASAVTHPHLLPVLDVTSDDDRIAVVSAWPRGGRLLELVRRRGPLTAAETLTVLIPIASALAAIHDNKVRHGGVGAASVFFDDAGRPQLGSLAIGTVVSDSNGGLPGDSCDVAPEVVRGERLNQAPVTPAADVFSLGSVALYCLTGSSAWPADDPTDVLIQSTAGVWPDPGNSNGPAAMQELIRQMLLPDPAARPTAADVARLLAAVGAPAPISFGAGSPADASSARWRGSLGRAGAARNGSPDSPPDVGPPIGPRSLRGSAGKPRAARSSRPGSQQGAAGSQPDSGVPCENGSPREPGSRPDRRNGRIGRHPEAQRRAAARILTHGPVRRPIPADWSPRPTPLARAGIAALSAVLAIVVAVQIWVWSTGHEDTVAAESTSAAASAIASGSSSPSDHRTRPGSAGVADVNARAAGPSSALVAAQDWKAVVTALDAARGRAISAADPGLLDQVYLPDTAAAQADAAIIRSMVTKGWRVTGAVHVVDQVTVLGAADARGAAKGAEGQRAVPGAAVLSSTAQAGQVGDLTAVVRVEVLGSLPSYPLVGADGRRIGATEPRPHEGRILSIASTPYGFRISAVQAG